MAKRKVRSLTGVIFLRGAPTAARPATQLMCRGFPAQAVFTKATVGLADKIVAGTLSGNELVKLIELQTFKVGEWWFLIRGEGGPGIEDSKDYAWDENTVQSDFGKEILADVAAGEDDTGELALPVVLVGKVPKGYLRHLKRDPWGNAFVDSGLWPNISLTEIHYASGVDGMEWTTVPISVSVAL